MKIVLGYDGSEAAKKALKQAADSESLRWQGLRGRFGGERCGENKPRRSNRPERTSRMLKIL